MKITVLRSKIHRATITDSCLHYEGSISLPESLVELAGIHSFEKVLVANVTNGNRFDTYVIIGKEEKITLNGAAAHLGKIGDKVIIMAWGQLDINEQNDFSPKVIMVDDHNVPKQI